MTHLPMRVPRRRSQAPPGAEPPPRSSRYWWMSGRYAGVATALGILCLLVLVPYLAIISSSQGI
ncbi:hypothetical protein ACIP5N_21195 [Streptomyces sp. NPDC088768]|uniref:hypothetical protein n=1 Tax=Streptomyces sp. NPDC088768 TaxID=3365894 RepID=UPI0037FA3F17